MEAMEEDEEDEEEEGEEEADEAEEEDYEEDDVDKDAEEEDENVEDEASIDSAVEKKREKEKKEKKEKKDKKEKKEKKDKKEKKGKKDKKEKKGKKDKKEMKEKNEENKKEKPEDPSDSDDSDGSDLALESQQIQLVPKRFFRRPGPSQQLPFEVSATSSFTALTEKPSVPTVENDEKDDFRRNEYPERCEAKADGLLLDFCRFIRLQAAQDAWLRRLTRQHTMAFLGRSLVDLDFSREGDGEQQFCTPFFARPGGSLHLGACYSVVPENPGHKDSKLLEFCEILEKSGMASWLDDLQGGEKKIGTDRARGVKTRFKEEIRKDIIKTLYSNKEATDYLQKPEKDEKDEISILRTAWWEFQIFRLQQPPKQPEIVEFLEVHGSKSSGDLREELSSLNQIVTVQAQRRESFVRQMMAVTPELEGSEWHQLLARLMLSLHSDLELFIQVQLPFLASDAADPDTQHRKTAAIAYRVPHEHRDHSPPFDLWDATRRESLDEI